MTECGRNSDCPTGTTAVPTALPAAPATDPAAPIDGPVVPLEDAAVPTGDAAVPTGDAASPCADTVAPEGKGTARVCATPPLAEVSSEGATEAAAAVLSKPSGSLPDAEAAAAGATAVLCSTEAMPTAALLVDAGDAAAAVWDAKLGSGDCNIILRDPEDGVAVPGLAVLSEDVTSEALWERRASGGSRPLAALSASIEGVLTPSMDPLRAAALLTVTGAFPCKAHD